MRAIYRVDGMHCANCQRRVTEAIATLPGVRDVAVDLANAQAAVDADGEVSLERVRAALAGAGGYRVHPENHYNAGIDPAPPNGERAASIRADIARIAPLIGMICLVTLLALPRNVPPLAPVIHWHGFMLDFMAGFFLIFGGLKLLNLRGFAAMFSRYDVIAAAVPAWGLIVPFVEVALGLAFLLRTALVPANIATVLLMGIGSIGVWRKLRAKDEVTCACLGGFFNVPVTPLTLAENLAMLIMAAAMLA